jgi:hypothetical protein
LPVFFNCCAAKYWSTDDFNVLKKLLSLLLKVTLGIIVPKIVLVSTLIANKMLLLPGEPLLPM